MLLLVKAKPQIASLLKTLVAKRQTASLHKVSVDKQQMASLLKALEVNLLKVLEVKQVDKYLPKQVDKLILKQADNLAKPHPKPASEVREVPRRPLVKDKQAWQDRPRASKTPKSSCNTPTPTARNTGFQDVFSAPTDSMWPPTESVCQSTLFASKATMWEIVPAVTKDTQF